MSVSDDAPKAKAGSFQSMNLDKNLLKGLSRMQYLAPTPVQRKALPIALAGVDIVCMARTGSGKTCVFLLPLVQKLKNHDASSGVRAVVLSPTRELAMQTFKFAKSMAKFTDLRIISIIGGDPIEAQFEALSARPDVIIATPGRLMHHLREVSTFKLKHVKYLVFDEADRLFEMGFAEQLNEIVRECPVERQTLLFSATMPKQLVQFSRAGLREPQLVRLDTDTKMSDELRMAFFCVRSNEKIAALLYLVRDIIPKDQLTIVFTATKHHSEFLHALLKDIGQRSTLIYGAMEQDARSANLRAFRNGEANFLIVTDVAARGIDIPLLHNVINFHFPTTPKLFVHRCGRAARQGRIGFALSLVEPEELPYVLDVHMFLGVAVYTPADPKRRPDNSSSSERAIEDTNSGLAGGIAGAGDSAKPSPVVLYTGDPYTLTSMTPDQIHTGRLPQDILDEENDSLKQKLGNEDTLMNFFRVSENGMKQFRRTRSEASKEGVRAARSIAKADAIREIHPLICGMDPHRANPLVIEKANFVRILQTFRPAQTVFETGIGTGTTSQSVKNKNKPGTKESKGVEVMQNLRRATESALERNKKRGFSLATFADADTDTGHGEGLHEYKDGVGPEDNEDDESVALEHMDDNELKDCDEFVMDSDIDEEDKFVVRHQRMMTAASYFTGAQASCAEKEKPRLSISERKKLKKQGLSSEAIAKLAQTRAIISANIVSSTVRGAEEDGASSDRLFKSDDSNSFSGRFRDPRFFMSYGNESVQANFAEESLHLHAGLRSNEAHQAAILESAMLDIMPEEAVEMNKKRRMLRWDAKKRKFVKQTLEEMSSAKKRVRTETGAVIKGSGRPQGEMYETWKKKTKREITMGGVGDDDDDDRPRPNRRVNSKVKDDLRSAEEIRKLAKERDNNKKKNMKKDKRTKLEGKARQNSGGSKGKSAKDVRMAQGKKKMKAIVRY